MSKQNGFSVIEISIAVVVIAVLGMVGWRVYETQFAETQNSSLNEQIAPIDMIPSEIANLTDLSVIEKDALGDKPGVTVIHVELEQNSAGLVYKAQVSDGTVIVYNARTGARIKSVEKTEKSTEVLPAGYVAGISFSKALEIARNQQPGSKVYKIELEMEDGIVVYSVRFTDKARVDVDAMNGTIVRTKAAKTEDKTQEHKSDATKSNDHSSDGDSADEPDVDSLDDDMTDNDDNDSDDSSSDVITSGNSGSDNSGSGSGGRP